MPLLLLHSRYRRTCNICGDSWTVTRRQAAGSPGRAPRPRRNRTRQSFAAFDVAASTDAFNGAVETWQGYRRCPHCGIDDFTQRAAGRTPEA
jgi:hypothetical protein